MADLQEKKGTYVEKNAKQEITNQEKTKEKQSFVETESEEKLERLHEAAPSISSIEPIQIGKIGNSKEKLVQKDETAVPNEEKPRSNELNIVSAGEKPVLRAEKMYGKPEEPVMNEETKLENQSKTDTTQETQRNCNSVVSCSNQAGEKIIRNQSDIFSLKEIPTTLQTSIFSVSGCPSRKVFRKQEPAGHLFQRNDDPPADKVTTSKGSRITKENYNDEKRPSSSYRNPLTGSGLSSNDEYKTTSKGVKRKDGNPLLGLGYDTEVVSATSQHRIPPGGYSHKLW